jgi:hypothetical protein
MTNTIEVVINEQRIWNPLLIGAKIAQALAQHDQVILDFVSEAPSIAHTELPDLFSMLATQGIDTQRIRVVTGNMLETSTQVQVQHLPEAMFEIEKFQAVVDDLPQHKQIQYHFGSLVSRTTMPRLNLSAFLYAQHATQTFQTFHWSDRSDYHKTHTGLEELIHCYGVNSTEFAQATKLLQSAPLVRDPILQYPILHPTNLTEPCSWYPKFFVDIVYETWHLGTNFFLTEKFWRAICTRTPFIVVGPQNILHNIRQLGFVTFSDWWDEGYDQDPAYHNIEEIKQVIDQLSLLSTTQLQTMYHSMSAVLDHNLARFRSLNYQDIHEAFVH